MLFFTSDTHFFHSNIIKYCNRPFSNVEKMNQKIIENWNNRVQEKDVVFHLGDIGFKNKTLEIISHLAGTKFLCRGNHDRSFSEKKLLDSGFQGVYKKPILIHHVTPYSIIPIFCMHSPVILRKNSINLCGHIHDEWKSREEGVLNVGVDVRDFTPISVTDLVSEFEKTFPDINIYRVRNRECRELLGSSDVCSG